MATRIKSSDKVSWAVDIQILTRAGKKILSKKLGPCTTWRQAEKVYAKACEEYDNLYKNDIVRINIILAVNNKKIEPEDW